MRSEVLMTKKNLIVMILFTVGILLSGCKKEAAEPDVASNQRKAIPVGSPGSQDLSNVQPKCENTIILYAGQFFNTGSLYYVNNSSGTIDFTYSVKAPWKITHVSLYVGDCASIPRNRAGNTIPGLYPYQKTVDGSGADSVLIHIPQDEVPNCGCIAAHAKVYNSSTGAIETAWAEG